MKKNEMSACESVERRKVVKSIVGGVTAVTAYSLLPAKWNSPLVESVFLPAHAATSGNNNPTNQNTNNGATNNAFVGTWEYKDGDNFTRFTFFNDQTCRCQSSSGTLDGTGTYIIQNNGELLGELSTPSGRFTPTFRMIDNNTIVHEYMGESDKYVRVK